MYNVLYNVCTHNVFIFIYDYFIFYNFLNYLFDQCACKILHIVDSIFSVHYSYSILCCNEYLDNKITLYRF